MSPLTLVVAVVLISAIAYQRARRRALAFGTPGRGSRPAHHGSLVALWCLIPGLLLVGVWQALSPLIIDSTVRSELEVANPNANEQTISLKLAEVQRAHRSEEFLATAGEDVVQAMERYREATAVGDQLLIYALIVIVMIVLVVSFRRLGPRLKARQEVETMLRWVLAGCSGIAVLTTVGIVLSVLFEALRFFSYVSPGEFLLGLTWSPQTAIRADQVGSSGAFGAIPLFAGTLLISGIAMLVAIPVGLLSAIYLAEYASRRLRAFAKPMLEVLAGIPTVVYGFFAALTVAPALRDSGSWLGLDVASESALAAGVVMGIMIIPFVSSLADDVITAVPNSLREGSLGLGATQSETIRRVVFPAALPGVVGGVLLAFSRAIGETMIVVMAAGLAARLTANPLESVTTVTVQIVTLLVGDQEFDSPKTLAAFALGLTLFAVTLILNIIALHVVRRYREQYD